MHHGSFLLLLSLLVSASAHAQLYKSVGPDGKITYSDAPPAKAAKVEQKNLAPASVTTQFPYELADAARKHPVTLYTAVNCSACDSGRNALNARGIPFTEKTVQTNDDIARLKQAGGDRELPLLTVGSKKETGFESEAWTRTLSAAGYPVNSQLPRTYRNPAPQPAAPVAAPAASNTTEPASAQETAGRSTDRPAAAGNAPPGFRF